jgi:membrane-bound lytic murein transglycosylase D
VSCCAWLLASATGLFAGGPEPNAPPAQPAGDDTYDAAKQLFDQFAPPEVKEQYDFPSRKQFEAFGAALQQALDGDSFEALAKYEPEGRQLLPLLRASPETAGYADWLAARLDELHMARAIAEAEASHAPTVIPREAPRGASALPYYDLWYRRMSERPPPPNAAALMPRLRAAFAAEGAPPELA